MKLAIFDFDGTLFCRDTLPCLGEEWVKQGRSKWKYIKTYMAIIPGVLLYKLGLLSRERMKYDALKKFQKLFQGMPRQEIETFFRLAYPGMRPYYNQDVLEEIKKAQAEGYHLVLLSGAYSDLLKLVAEEFGIDTVIGAELQYKDDYIDYSREISFVDGASKLELLQEIFADKDIDWGLSRSYGDSFSDRPVLEIAGEAVVVNPERKLLNYAVNKEWRVMEYCG